MTPQEPLVSIVLPTHNGARYLRQSVESCLQQSHRNIELVIVDDASTDETPAIIGSISDPRLVVVRNERNLKLPASLNVGFSRARGDYLTWTSDDNYYAPEAAERMVCFLRSSGGHFAYCDYYRFPDDSPDRKWLVKLPDEPHLEDANRIGPCFLYSREVMEKVGNYDEDAFLAEDYDYWIRVSRSFPMRHLSEPLLYYREHAGSLTAAFEKSNEVKIVSLLVRVKNGISPVEREAGRFAIVRARRLLARSQVTTWASQQVSRYSFGRLSADRLLAPVMVNSKAVQVLRDLSCARTTLREARAAGKLAGRPHGEDRQHTVLLHTGNFGAPSEVWIYRHAIRLKRYRCRVAAQEHLNRDEFPFPCIRHFDHPSQLVHRLMQLECALRTLQWPTTSRLRVWRLKKAVAGAGADLVHTYFLFNGPAAAGAAQECGIPLIVTAPGTDVNRARVNEHYRESLQPVFRTAARIVAVSDFIAARLVEIGCPPEKIMRVNLLAPMPEETADAGAQGERINVICVARLTAVKGHRCLLDAFARASRQEPRLFLTLVGDGELRPEIEEQVARLGIRDRVQLTGSAEPSRVQELLKGSHIYAQHSIAVREERPGIGPSMSEEGLPVSMIEAAGFGLPIVGTRTGGVPEICRDGENGFLVDERDAEGMAERLLALARDPQLRAQMGRAGRALAEREFDAARQIEKLEALYDQVLAESRRAARPRWKPGWMSRDFEAALASVIIPTYNRAGLIGETLESVRAQTYRPIEIIVVDDGSTDDTQDVVRRFAEATRGDLSVRYVRQENQGSAAARNRGLRECRGEFIQFLDSDDLLHPDKLSAQAAVMRGKPHVECVFSQWQKMNTDAPGSPYGWPERFSADRESLVDHLLLKDMRHNIPLWTSNGLYRRSLWLKIGPWDADLRECTDPPCNMRWLALGLGYRYVPTVHAWARVHGNQITGRLDQPESIARRRAGWHKVQDILRATGWLDRRRRRLLARVYYNLARPAFIAGDERLGTELLRDGLALAPLSGVWMKLSIARIAYRALGVDAANRLFAVRMKSVHNPGSRR